MPQWEYSKIDLNDGPRKTEDIDVLNGVGEQGWQLIAITANNFAYLMRQVAEPAPVKPPRRKAAGS